MYRSSISTGVKTTLISTVMVLISGCATQAVTKESRDTTGKFNGSWTAEIFKAASPQRALDWTFRCTDLSQKVPMTVNDGEVSIALQGQVLSSYISEAGEFKIGVDAGRTTASTASEVALSNPNIRVFVNGDLSATPATGTLVIGLAEIGFRGCTSKMNFTRN